MNESAGANCYDCWWTASGPRSDEAAAEHRSENPAHYVRVFDGAPAAQPDPAWQLSPEKRSTPPDPTGEWLVCVYCGRRGKRGFVISSGIGDGRDTYACANSAACERRQAAQPDETPEAEHATWCSWHPPHRQCPGDPCDCRAVAAGPAPETQR